MKPSISERYLKKIGFNRTFSPTLQNLQEILLLHVQNIPFGNIASFLHEDVSLDPQIIADKLLEQGSEGYCFEQNILSKIALNELGFKAFNLLARVYYQQLNIETSPPLTHLVTIVDIDQTLYLYDTGFGGVTPTGVLSLNELNNVQQTPLENYRLIDVHDLDISDTALIGMRYMLQVWIDDQWMNIYAFNPASPCADSDIMLANWYISTSPTSGFTQNLMLATIKNLERVSLKNNILRHILPHSGSNKKELISLDDFTDAFKNSFNIENVDFDQIFKKLNNSKKF